MTEKTTLEVTIKSPHGKQPVSQFIHWLNKVADDAKARWGIEITVEEQAEESDHNTDFQ